MKKKLNMSRRPFLMTGGLLAAAPAIASQEIRIDDKGEAVKEPARNTSVVESTDVVVCGGGPAGVAAAIAAARKGARVVLIELQGCLGGVWTSGLLSSILDFENKDGLMEEFVEKLESRGGRAVNKLNQPTKTFDVEAMKFALETWCEKTGITLHFHTRVVSVVKDGDRLTHVIAESKSGRMAVEGTVFIDATGDGDLGAQAGCEFEVGHPESGATQPMSMLALVGGIQASEIRDFYIDEPGQPWAPSKNNLRKVMEEGGHSPSYTKPTLWRIRDDLFCLMANHEYGYNGLSEKDVTRATIQARRELNELIDGLRSTGGVWSDIHLVATPEQIGIREGRRLRGRYTLTVDDLKVGRRFEDGICPVTFCVDIHSLDPKKGKAIETLDWKMKPYDIPLRALIAKDVDGLLFAGRCISGDFYAHASYRVTGNAVAMGEAAGKAASAAVLRGCLPAEVSISELG